jgi:probable rRNA maturation factor
LIILEHKVPGATEGSLERFLLRARRGVGLRGAVNVLITTNSAMQKLNREFRAKNKPTDVLSFPAASLNPGKPALAGEIAISADIAQQNAKALGHALGIEVKILILHGLLHLAGFDHERDNGEMAAHEARLRRLLKLPVALIERTSGATAKRRRSHPGSRAKRGTA